MAEDWISSFVIFLSYNRMVVVVKNRMLRKWQSMSHGSAEGTTTSTTTTLSVMFNILYCLITLTQLFYADLL